MTDAVDVVEVVLLGAAFQNPRSTAWTGLSTLKCCGGATKRCVPPMIRSSSASRRRMLMESQDSAISRLVSPAAMSLLTNSRDSTSQHTWQRGSVRVPSPTPAGAQGFNLGAHGLIQGQLGVAGAGLRGVLIAVPFYSSWWARRDGRARHRVVGPPEQTTDQLLVRDAVAVEHFQLRRSCNWS